MLILALRHLDTCMKHARRLDAELPEALCDAHDDFLQQFQSESIKDLRDVLEHEEGRMSGLDMKGSTRTRSTKGTDPCLRHRSRA